MLPYEWEKNRTDHATRCKEKAAKSHPPDAAAADTILTPVLEPINHLSPGATVSGSFPFNGMRPINSKMSFQKYLKTSAIFWLYHLRRGNQVQWSGMHLGLEQASI